MRVCCAARFASISQLEHILGFFDSAPEVLSVVLTGGVVFFAPLAGGPTKSCVRAVHSVFGVFEIGDIAVRDVDISSSRVTVLVCAEVDECPSFLFEPFNPFEDAGLAVVPARVFLSIGDDDNELFVAWPSVGFCVVEELCDGVVKRGESSWFDFSL